MQETNLSSSSFEVSEAYLNNIIEGYPFSIAVSYKKISEKENSSERLMAVFETYENLVIYFSVVILSLYYKENQPHQAIETACRKLESPTLEDCISFLGIAVANFTSPCSLVQKIREWYISVEEKKEIYLQEIYDFKKYERDIGLLTYFQENGKKIAPLLSIMVEEEIKSYFQFSFSCLRKILKEAEFLQDYPLLYSEENTLEKKTFKKLMGSNENFEKIVLFVPREIALRQVFLNDRKAQEFYSLHPFFLYQECYYCIREELPSSWELLLFYGRTSSRISYHGCKHNLSLKDPLSIYQPLRDRQVSSSIKEENSSYKKIWEISFQKQEEIINYFKNIKILKKYHERRYPEFMLESFLESSQSLFVLAGEKGVGKTVLLIEMAKRWSAQGEMVFFLPVFGNRGLSLEEELCEICKIEKLNTTVSNIQKESSAKWVVILDGIENTTKPQEFFENLKSFLSRYHQFIKVVVSIRDIYVFLWKEYFEGNSASSLKDFAMFVEGECPLMESNRWYYLLPLLNQTEAKKLYQTISHEMPVPPGDFLAFPYSIKSMMRNPSIMYLFVSCVKSQEVPKKMGVLDLMEGFILNQINFSKGRREFLEKLVELMLKGETNHLELDVLIEKGDMETIQQGLLSTTFSQVTDLIQEGFLGRVSVVLKNSIETFLYFPITFLREYMIYRSQALLGKHQDEILLEFLKNIQPGKDCLYAIFYFSLLRLSSKQYFDRVIQIVSQASQHKPFMRNILYHILISRENAMEKPIEENNSIDTLIKSVNNFVCPEVLLAFTDFAIYLWKENRFAQSAFLLEKLSNHISYPIENYHPLFIMALCAYSYHKAQDSKNAIKMIRKAYKVFKSIEGHPQELEFYCFFGDLHQEIGERDKAEFFFQKCMEKQKKIEGTLIEAMLYEGLGKIAKSLKDNVKALSCFQKQHAILKKLGRKEKAASSLVHLANIHQNMGNTADSMSFYNEAIDTLEEIGDIARLALCRQSMGILLADSGKLVEARNTLLQCLPVLETLENNILLAQTYLYLGKINEFQKQEAQSREYLQKAMLFLKKSDNKEGIAQCYEKFAILDYKKGSLDQAISYFLKAREIFQEIHNKAGLANVDNNLGRIYQSKGHHKEARRYFEQSLKMRQEQNDILGSAEVETNIATMLIPLKEFQEATERIQKAKEIYEKYKEKKGLAIVKGTQALLYKMQNINSKALECYEECAKLLESINERSGLGAIYNSIGLIYKDRSDYYQALSFFEKSAKIQDAIGDLVGLAASYNNMGLIYDAKNEYEKALEFYSKDLQITEKTGDKKSLAASYNNIAMLHHNHKNYARSLWYLEKAASLYIEMHDKDMLKKIQDRIQMVKEKI
ncbi:MAG: tetratricopeptide repeat protein [Candidatus Brocadiae bacterium]|nr:tetratricopeptide repeat protein [Candidatus Brocadiia bacterium]